MPTNNYSRRRFLQHSSLGVLSFAAFPSWLQAMPEMASYPANKASANFKPDVELELIARANSLNILPGKATGVMQYFAKLLKGPANTVTVIPGSFLGPIIRLQKGQKVRVHYHNQLNEPSITHWHGLHVPTLMDGQPQYAIAPGEKFVYEFEVLNRASMNIYHPHPHGRTAAQVYHGLAGALVVNDEEEAKLELPAGDYEVPIVIQDKFFDSSNQLAYAHSMHDRMLGYYGDKILVNGQMNFGLNAASRAYRLRIMNGSTARIYKLAWDDGMPMTVLGVDGGLLVQPEVRKYVMLAPGERLDVWADFSGRSVGSQVSLVSLPFSGVLPKMAERMQAGHKMGMGGMGGMGMMHANLLPVGSQFPIFKVSIKQQQSDSPKLPSQLSKITRYQQKDTANPEKPVPIGISEAPMAMLLNGRPYKHNDALPSERIRLNSIQLLEIFHAHGGAAQHGGDADKSAGSMAGMQHSSAQKSEASGGHGMMGMMGGMHKPESNSDPAQKTEQHSMGGMGGMGGGGMGMMLSMAHPIHLHGQSFQILSRSIGMGEEENYATVKDGFIDSGWKDTVLVMPGEKVHIIKPFQDFKGPFPYHCHNLEHEDLGMMREFWVE